MWMGVDIEDGPRGIKPQVLVAFSLSTPSCLLQRPSCHLNDREGHAGFIGALDMHPHVAHVVLGTP